MNFVNKNNGLELAIEGNLLHRIGQVGVEHFPNEFGGFLIGSYSCDFKTVYVSDFILPKRYRGFPFFFERYIDGLANVFKRIFKEKNKYYIGEWHTHPNASTMYSQTDLNAMIETVECDTVQIRNPILLILSVTQTKVNGYSFYFYNDKKLIPYEQN